MPLSWFRRRAGQAFVTRSPELVRYAVDNSRRKVQNAVIDSSEVYDKWFDGALPNMVNEDAPLTGHNTFHLMYLKHYDMAIPPVKERKPRPPKAKRSKQQRR